MESSLSVADRMRKVADEVSGASTRWDSIGTRWLLMVALENVGWSWRGMGRLGTRSDGFNCVAKGRDFMVMDRRVAFLKYVT